MDELIGALKHAIGRVGHEAVKGVTIGAAAGVPAAGIAGAAVKAVWDEFEDFRSILEKPGADKALHAVMKEYGWI